jgi:hypothetical protein
MLLLLCATAGEQVFLCGDDREIEECCSSCVRQQVNRFNELHIIIALMQFQCQASFDVVSVSGPVILIAEHGCRAKGKALPATSSFLRRVSSRRRSHFGEKASFLTPERQVHAAQPTDFECLRHAKSGVALSSVASHYKAKTATRIVSAITVAHQCYQRHN